MHFQLEVYYYSNEADKNKYKNVQLIASTKKNLKIAKRLYSASYSQRQLVILCCLDFKVLRYLDLFLLESIFIELESLLSLENFVCFSKI